MEYRTRASQLVFAAFLASSFLLDSCGGFVEEPSKAIDFNYARSTPLCSCRQAAGGNCKARQLRSSGRLCSAVAPEFRVSLRVTSGCHGGANRPVPSAEVRIWQANEDGLYDCSDGCGSHLITDGAGRVVFTAPRPGAVVHGWEARLTMVEADGVTRFAVSHAHESYATKTGFIALGNSSVDDAGATCQLSDSGDSGLTNVDCTVLLSCRSEISAPDQRTSRAVEQFLNYVDRQQVSLRAGKSIPDCPRAKHVANYFQKASNAIIVQLCSSTCPQPGCAASGLVEFARPRQDLYAVRLVSLLKEPDYCPGQQDNCTAGRLQRLDRGDGGHGVVLLLDASSLGECCEALVQDRQYVAIGVALPSPQLSSPDVLHDGQSASTSEPPLPKFWATAVFPVKRVFKRLLARR